MLRPNVSPLLRVLLPLVALCLLGGPAVAGGKPSSSKLVSGTETTTTQTTTTTETTLPSLNEFLLTQDWAPTGDVDPTNVPLLSGDFLSLSASIAPAQAKLLRARDAQRLATGSGVVVAVLDSGFNLAAPVISTRLAGSGCDTFDYDGVVTDMGDRVDGDLNGVTDLGVGHGTFVTSLIARCAPNAKILPIRVADDEGRCTSLSVAEGLRMAVEAGARVINASFHLDTTSWAVQYWLQVAEERGIVVVCAAGNEGVDYMKVVAKAPTTLTVGAVDETDRLVDFSNYGPMVDVYAPGVRIEALYGTPTSGQLAVWSGTSFAAGFVSGAAALVVQRHPTWSPAMVRDVLRTSVMPAHPLGDEPMFGGRIDLLMAASR